MAKNFEFIIDVESFDLSELLESTLPMSFYDLRKDRLRSWVVKTSVILVAVGIVLCNTLTLALMVLYG